jgi:glycosyltransferase involved in cell wall biosynthesis
MRSVSFIGVESRPEVSVVIPCLNEEAGVAAVVGDAWTGIERSGRSGEVIVVDNGSTDRSAELAEEAGARVVRETRRGYGSAYLRGLSEARGEYIVMADADGTYPLRRLPEFVDLLEQGNELVLGSRFKGTIHKGAMPWTHRWIGNPVLTFILNVFYGVSVSDAHCGMRAIRRSSVPKLELQATGMEFASEMILKASKRKLRVGEIPIDYEPRIGESKLNTWRDGWRHLRFMLLHSSTFLFLIPGGALLVLGLAIMLPLANGPVTAFGLTWYIHAMIAGSLATLVGAQILQLGLFARAYALLYLNEHDPWLERAWSRVRLEHGLLLGAAICLLGGGILIAIFAEWASGGFRELGRVHEALLGMTLVGLGMQTLFGSFFLSVLGLRRHLRLGEDQAPAGSESDREVVHV